MEQIRSFISIELPNGVKTRLAELEERLNKAGRVSARWVKPDNIHLTMKFLGDVEADKIPDITRVMAEAIAGIPPFLLEINGLGAFPNLNRIRVVWVGIKGELERLNALQQKHESALEPLGFAAEKKRFSPHLTLARVNERALQEERRGLGRLLAATEFKPVNMKVETVDLMKSRLTGAGAVYTKLKTVRLTG